MSVMESRVVATVVVCDDDDAHNFCDLEDELTGRGRPLGEKAEAPLQQATAAMNAVGKKGIIAFILLL